MYISYFSGRITLSLRVCGAILIRNRTVAQGSTHVNSSGGSPEHNKHLHSNWNMTALINYNVTENIFTQPKRLTSGSN